MPCLLFLLAASSAIRSRIKEWSDRNHKNVSGLGDIHVCVPVNGSILDKHITLAQSVGLRFIYANDMPIGHKSKAPKKHVTLICMFSSRICISLGQTRTTFFTTG